MSQQVTTTVDGDVKTWLETMKDDLGVSEAEVMRRCLRAVQTHDDPHGVLQPFDSTTVSPWELREELRALQQRVSRLEDDPQDSPRKESAHAPRERSHDAESIDADWVSQRGDWSDVEASETEARNRALADAYNRLRDAGELQSSAIVDVYDDHDLSVKKSHWKGEIRDVLRTLPGVDAPGKGQSTYHFRLDE